MSNSRVDTSTATVQVETSRTRTTAAPPATPFSQVLASGANVLLTGAEVVTGVVGGPVLAAVVRQAGNQLIGAATSGAAGGAANLSGNAVGAANGAGGQTGEVSQMRAMQSESHAFNLQLLSLQQEVQDENRRFTTVSNCLKAAHDTAKAAVTNLHS